MRFALALFVLLVANTARAENPTEPAWRSNERVTCSIAAGIKFGVPVNIVLAIAQIEGGRPGQWVRNRNGTYDVGPMQFNTRYLEHLRRHYGITAADVATAGCYSYELAAWRLRKHLDRDRGDQWTRVANYHSRSPAENERYRAKVIRVADAWGKWLFRHVANDHLGQPRLVKKPSLALLTIVAKRAPVPQRRRARGSSGTQGDEMETALLRELVEEDCRN